MNAFANRLAGLLPLALLGAQPVLAERPACIHHGDARVVLRMALPAAIEGLQARCKAVLPPDAFLPSEGTALAARYRQEAPVDPARARKAIEDATGQDLSSFASDDTPMILAHQFVEDLVTKHVAVKDCDTIDGLVALAAPLRADAMAEALLLALQVAGPDKTKGLAICPPKDETAGR